MERPQVNLSPKHFGKLDLQFSKMEKTYFATTLKLDKQIDIALLVKITGQGRTEYRELANIVIPAKFGQFAFIYGKCL